MISDSGVVFAHAGTVSMPENPALTSTGFGKRQPGKAGYGFPLSAGPGTSSFVVNSRQPNGTVDRHDVCRIGFYRADELVRLNITNSVSQSFPGSARLMANQLVQVRFETSHEQVQSAFRQNNQPGSLSLDPDERSA